MPTLTDGDLIVRPFRDDDAGALAECIADPASTRVGESGAARRGWRWRAIGSNAHGPTARRAPETSWPSRWTATGPGRVSLRYDGVGGAELGFETHPDQRGRHVALRATRLMCRFGFEEHGCQVIRWHAFVGNWPSRRIAWRLGFRFEGEGAGWPSPPTGPCGPPGERRWWPASPCAPAGCGWTRRGWWAGRSFSGRWATTTSTGSSRAPATHLAAVAPVPSDSLPWRRGRVHRDQPTRRRQRHRHLLGAGRPGQRRPDRLSGRRHRPARTRLLTRTRPRAGAVSRPKRWSWRCARRSPGAGTAPDDRPGRGRQRLLPAGRRTAGMRLVGVCRADECCPGARATWRSTTSYRRDLHAPSGGEVGPRACTYRTWARPAGQLQRRRRGDRDHPARAAVGRTARRTRDEDLPRRDERAQLVADRVRRELLGKSLGSGASTTRSSSRCGRQRAADLAEFHLAVHDRVASVPDRAPRQQRPARRVTGDRQLLPRR